MNKWMDYAACTEVAPDLFFADMTLLAETKHAKKICETCPVKDQCLQYALENRIEHGVWGGLTINERRSLLRRSKVFRKK